MGLCAFYGYEPNPLLYIPVVLGSLLPDIDHPHSQVGKLTQPVSGFLARYLGHRGVTHSLLAVVGFTSLLFASAEGMGANRPSSLLAAVSIGYLSHLLADYLTLTGIPLLWPLKLKFSMPLMKLRVGSPVEHALTLLMVGVFCYHMVYGR